MCTRGNLVSADFTALVLTRFMEPMLQNSLELIEEKPTDTIWSDPDVFQIFPGQTINSPEIIHQEFVPSNLFFANMKCKAWRIIWPAYGDADGSTIPTDLSLTSGCLSSVYYLNHSDPLLTHHSTLSLYKGQRVYASIDMPDLDHSFGNIAHQTMQFVYFQKSDISMHELVEWVRECPQKFKMRWPGIGTGHTRMDYQENDFIQFWLSKSNQYGIIRIVSESPRIIEVYLAVENSLN